MNKRIKKEDLTMSDIWEVAEVEKIPHGWKRRVYYDIKKEELISELVSGNEYSVYPESVIFLEEFISVDSWYSQIPFDAYELGVEIDEDGEPIREQLLEAYQTMWMEDYAFPELNYKKEVFKND
jgi:hypothetical protein